MYYLFIESSYSRVNIGVFVNEVSDFALFVTKAEVLALSRAE